MTLKVLMLLTTYVLLVYGNNAERKGNKGTCRTRRHCEKRRLLFPLGNLGSLRRS